MAATSIVIGAGLAGAAAAATLRAAGVEVVVLEARDRVGGRGCQRPFAGDGEPLDFGGAWITPWQHRVRSLCAEHGVELRPRHPITERRWFRDGDLHRDAPAAAEHAAAHEAALARVAADARRVEAGHADDEEGRPLNVSMAAYLARLAPPQATRDLLTAWWTVSGSGDMHRVPASELLDSCAHGDGTPDGICAAWQDTLVGGVPALAERMIEASGATLRTSCPVARIEHDATGVTTRLAGGEALRADWCVVATGINPLRHVELAPVLAAEKATALAGGHLGRAVKVWARVLGVPVGALATGGGAGIEWMFAERETGDGAAMLVGFGVADGPFAFEREARGAVERFFPEGELLAVDWHDWNEDPFAQGTWVSSDVGRESAFTAETWRPEGRLVFASSDVAPRDAGWFEGAVVSGELAAQVILQGGG